jgi:hypothetical protein
MIDLEGIRMRKFPIDRMIDIVNILQVRLKEKGTKRMCSGLENMFQKWMLVGLEFCHDKLMHDHMTRNSSTASLKRFF